MLLVIIFAGIYHKAHTGPSFVKFQLLSLFLCNLGGLVFSCSMVKRKFYDSAWTFTWQSFWIVLYYGGNLLSGWFCAYRYLVTSKSIQIAIKKRKDAMEAQEDDKNTPLLESDQPDKHRKGCCRNGQCCSHSGLKCYSCYWMYCLCSSVALWMFDAGTEWDCTYESSDPSTPTV